MGLWVAALAGAGLCLGLVAGALGTPAARVPVWAVPLLGGALVLAGLVLARSGRRSPSAAAGKSG